MLQRPDFPTRRPIYESAALKRLFHPTSVAIVGASPRAGSFGERSAANLKHFKGPTYLVNAKYETIGDAPCYPSIEALPQPPDLVIITTALNAVEDVVRECVRANVGGIVIYASGYAETGLKERHALQQNLTDITAGTATRILGPNCVGFINADANAYVSFSNTPYFGEPSPHALGLVSQSGAIGLGLAQAVERGVSFSHVIAPGNSCDVDVADCINYLVDDDTCRTILCVFEGMPQPMRLLQAAERARQAGKFLITFKLGVGEIGAQAAMSHTGSLAGANEAYRAAFERAGIITVDSVEALIEFGSFFAKAAAPKSPGVAIAAASGGAAIMAADMAEKHGVQLPPLRAETANVLAQHVPEFGSIANPCDVTAQVVNYPTSLHACADALFRDPAYDVLIMPHPYAYEASRKRACEIGDIAQSHNKILCLAWMSEWLEGPGAIDAERHPAIAVFRSMDRCFQAIAAHRQWYANQQFNAQTASRRLSDSSAAAHATTLIQASAGLTLTESESKAVLKLYGVPVVEERLVQSEDDAVDAALAVGLPVALKVESPQIPHKTEAGVIRLNITDVDGVRSAFRTVMQNAQRWSADAEIRGVLVQPMAPKGIEVIVGGRIDPMFGPLLMVGLGGIMVEIMRDVTYALAPVTPREAERMLQNLRGYPLLEGYRGAPSVDFKQLSACIARISEFLGDQQNEVEEVDVNPIICAENKLVAVDALIARRESHDLYHL